jgi:hypothetical protein
LLVRAETERAGEGALVGDQPGEGRIVAGEVQHHVDPVRADRRTCAGSPPV